VTSQSDDADEQQQAWKSLSKAGLVEIALDEFPERIKEVKHVVMGRLSELLELKNGIQERDSAAYSLGTLKNLETTLLTDAPPAGQSRRSEK
jgi:hypothetical protein